MSFSKVVPLGSMGQVEFNESEGQASMVLSVGGSLGGGSVAGALKGKASIEVDASAIQFADAALLVLKEKFPALAGVIDTVKLAMDAEAKNI